MKKGLGIGSLIIGIPSTVLSLMDLVNFTNNWHIWLDTGSITTGDLTLSMIVVCFCLAMALLFDGIGIYLLK